MTDEKKWGIPDEVLTAAGPEGKGLFEETVGPNEHIITLNKARQLIEDGISNIISAGLLGGESELEKNDRCKYCSEAENRSSIVELKEELGLSKIREEQLQTRLNSADTLILQLTEKNAALQRKINQIAEEAIGIAKSKDSQHWALCMIKELMKLEIVPIPEKE